MKVVYVAGAFRAATTWEVERNVRKAEEIALMVATCGAMPLCPHTNTRFFNGLLTAQFWIDGTLELMERADAVFLVPDWENSAGTQGEVERADALRIPVFDTEKNLRAWIGVGPIDEEVVLWLRRRWGYYRGVLAACMRGAKPCVVCNELCASQYEDMHGATPWTTCGGCHAKVSP